MQLVPSHGFKSVILTSLDLSTASIVDATKSMSSTGFLFVAYSHGGDDCLYYDRQKKTYVSVDTNIDCFSNALVYTWACSCGKELGAQLVKSGCRAFFGYESLIYAPTFVIEIFVRCANSGIESLLAGSNALETYERMYQSYTDEIDTLRQTDAWAASFLRRNRDALILLGQHEATINDF